MKASMRLAFSLLAAVPFLMVLGNSMLFPTFPKMQSALHLSGFQTSLVVTAFSIPAGILIPLAGYLSDRYGRKIVMAPAMIIFGIGALVAALSITFLKAPYWGLIAGRVIQGAGAAGMAQLAMALTADIFRSNERAKVLGLLESANGLGKVVSPVSGAVAGLILWFLPFYVFAVLALPLGVLLWVIVKEPKMKRPQRALGEYLMAAGQIFRTKGRAMGAALVTGALVMFVLFGTLFFLSETLEKRYGMAELTSGFILALPVAALSGTSFLVGNYMQRHARMSKLSITVGMLLITAVEVVLVFFSQSRMILFMAISLMGFGGGLVLPCLTLLITSATSPDERGFVTSLYGGARFVGVALGPPIVGWLMGFGDPYVFAVTAALALGSGIFSWTAISPQKLLETSGPTRQGDARWVIAFRRPPKPRESH